MITEENIYKAILEDIFSALDGDATVSFEIGRMRRGDGTDGGPITIGGIQSFMAEWDVHQEPPALGIRWEDMTNEQRFERSKWSAQHALIKRLADLKAQFEHAKEKD